MDKDLRIMFPISLYIYAAAAIITGGSLWYARHEHNALSDFKVQIEAQAKVQEAQNIAKVKQSELVNKGIQNEYDAKLSALRNYYANRVQHSNTSNLPTNADTTKIADPATAYTILAGQCAETSQQLVSLQDWINQQVGIK